ncbi:RNA polymerase sigma-70 factor (ECF subfamily) [Chitinophaga polysaccharea]|uniref:RNA polymerase sigma-70 factor (ECF subfamily) n=1 Tax=Chitinophaga polysaccharea TaxID=1293035 RepID=A0A561PQX6_9BACT|nr:sigma-70 family RNA polymerase sigma factor [Chitinophaga polysaccharea]TWF40509.1 RNA polymerase sigma-70 factor (ECF subfamily) [Chitinophaga polysaccharea]
MIHENEQELLLSVASGDERSFQVLVTKYWPQVYGTALRLTRSPEQAKDLSQDIFIKLWNSRERLPGVANPATFIYVCARHLIMDHLRKKVLHTDNIDLLADCLTASQAGNAQSSLEYKELEQSLTKAIELLPEKLREVFVLHRFSGLSHAQISRKLNISVVSSQTYVVRALRSIREYLSHHSERVLILLLVFSNFFS